MTCKSQINTSGNKNKSIRRWTRHGSTKYLWDMKNLDMAIIYVRDEQGEVMSYLDNHIDSEEQIACTPLAYLITFSSYGSWLHGDDRGSVNKKHNIPGTTVIQSNQGLNLKEKTLMKNEMYSMDEVSREIVKNAINEVCLHRGWLMHAVHVRTTHVHVVVSADQKAERVMRDFKAYSTRALNSAGL